MARHLSTKQLTSWLNGAADHEQHTEHLDTCRRCTERVEQLTLNNVEPLKEEFRPALMAVLEPPSDLHERISARIAERLQSQSDASLLGSMLATSVETVRVIVEPNSDTD